MVTSLYTADVKLNKTDKTYHKYIIIVNPDNGVLMVNRGLFSLSFESLESAFNQDVDVINKHHIGDINL